ncbi:hypothetical protein [Ferrimonas lipolytica]|uniref:MSHA biogenesis protein MshF n=1 Tax=Ferrimonas lipolytica TaxID=2724191 RepID=A0A6H1UH12_9GAMM|nr:hypothetical protein [Ferrimonas lipolytica]QIZ77919.1 hypothetical protein HER31_14055 [Ferrimonas lipolytica]
MSRQQRADTRQQRLFMLLLSLLIMLVLWWRLPIGEIEKTIPATVVQQRFIDSLLIVRGNWLVKNKPVSLSSSSPDGNVYTLTVMSAQGWPQPQHGCQLLWQQLMGKPAEALLVRQQQRADYCSYLLTTGGELHYYPSTGSVLLYN